MELTVKTTPSLMVCVVPEPRPSQSNEVVSIVVFAVTEEVELRRKRPVPVIVVGPAKTLAAPRLSVPLTVMLEPAERVVPDKLAVAPASTVRWEPEANVMVPVENVPAWTLTAPLTLTALPLRVEVPALFLLSVPFIVQEAAAGLMAASPSSFRLSVPSKTSLPTSMCETLRVSWPVPLTVVVTAPPPSQSKSPAASVIVVLPPMLRWAVPAIAIGRSIWNRDSSIEGKRRAGGNGDCVGSAGEGHVVVDDGGARYGERGAGDGRDGTGAVERRDVVAAIHVHSGTGCDLEILIEGDRVALSNLQGGTGSSAKRIGQRPVDDKRKCVEICVCHSIVDVDDAGFAIAVEVDRVDAVGVDRERSRGGRITVDLNQAGVFKGLFGNEVDVADVDGAIAR